MICYGITKPQTHYHSSAMHHFTVFTHIYDKKRCSNTGMAVCTCCTLWKKESICDSSILLTAAKAITRLIICWWLFSAMNHVDRDRWKACGKLMTWAHHAKRFIPLLDSFLPWFYILGHQKPNIAIFASYSQRKAYGWATLGRIAMAYEILAEMTVLSLSLVCVWTGVESVSIANNSSSAEQRPFR